MLNTSILMSSDFPSKTFPTLVPIVWVISSFVLPDTSSFVFISWLYTCNYPACKFQSPEVSLPSALIDWATFMLLDVGFLLMVVPIWLSIVVRSVTSKPAARIHTWAISGFSNIFQPRYYTSLKCLTCFSIEFSSADDILTRFLLDHISRRTFPRLFTQQSTVNENKSSLGFFFRLQMRILNNVG